MLEKILEELRPYQAKLVAVSKTKSPEVILEMLAKGQKAFGENRVQELLSKYETLPKEIEWHFIGHLQTNKVKYLVPFVHLIHSVDSYKLIREINKQARKINRVVDCLLEFKIAQEESKHGFDKNSAFEMLSDPAFGELKHIRILGIMGMGTFTYDEKQIRQEFQQLHQIFTEVKETYFADDENFREISMGMSADYRIALEEGSTMVRIGSLIFGPRN